MSFEKESADLLSLTDKPLNLTFHKNISKNKGRGGEGGLPDKGEVRKCSFSGGGGGAAL